VTSCIVDSAAIYIMVVKFRNTIWPPPPQLSLHRTAVLSSNSKGTRSVYCRKNPKNSLYCEMSMYYRLLSTVYSSCIGYHNQDILIKLFYTILSYTILSAIPSAHQTEHENIICLITIEPRSMFWICGPLKIVDDNIQYLLDFVCSIFWIWKSGCMSRDYPDLIWQP
jgi:hypothetical protein